MKGERGGTKTGPERRRAVEAEDDEREEGRIKEEKRTFPMAFYLKAGENSSPAKHPSRTFLLFPVKLTFNPEYGNNR